MLSRLSLSLPLFLSILLASSSSSLAQDAPVKVSCPPSLIRPAGPPLRQSLSPEETAYISARTHTVLPTAFKAYLENVKAALPHGASLPPYVSDILAPPPPPPPPPSRLLPNPSPSPNPDFDFDFDFPRLGIALSGGGLRAAYFAAGVLTSLDVRNTTRPTGTNGLLQAATYLSALSGGAWFATALVQADFPTVPELVFPPAINSTLSSSPSSNPNSNPNSEFGGFLTDIDMLLPEGEAGDNSAYFAAIVAELGKKHAAGFPVTLTDAWGREVARHFVNGTTRADILQEGTHGSGILFSGLQNLPTIKSHTQPFPIILANAIPPLLTADPNDPTELADVIPGNDVPVSSEIWEFNLFETGSWDPSLASFIPTRLLGSTPSRGCVVGFDQAAYIAGVSSNVWNGENLTTDFLALTPEGPVLQLIQTEFPDQAPVRMDAGAVPNPFEGIKPGVYSASNESFVALVDGGSNGEVCPLQPLIVRARGVDVIFAIDASADEVDSFTNGTDLITTAARAARFPNTIYPFPSVPSSPSTFIAQNLTSRPTFFGCAEPDVPLVIYLANGAPSAGRRALGLPGITNIPTAVTSYSAELAQSFLDESFAIATQGLGLGNNSTDPGAQWSTCLACALVDRARSRRGIEREGLCVACFENFCWDGRE